MTEKTQLDFLGLESFFPKRKDYQSFTLELVDQLPFFCFSKKRYLSEIDTINSTIFHREKVYETELSPAIWSKKNKEGKFDKFMALPNRREEVVMNALRFLACQQIIPFQNEEKQNLVSITFTLEQLRKHLASNGHGWKWQELKESIIILSRSHYDIHCGELEISGSLLMGITSAHRKADSKYRATFHPLISQAILSDAHYPIDYYDLTKIKNNLGRWIYKKLVHEVRNAEPLKFVDLDKGRGLQFTYDQAINCSGIVPAKERKENYRTIKNALIELRELSLIHHDEIYCRPYEVVKNKQWLVFPSEKTIKVIFDGHKRGKAQDKLQASSHVVKKNET